MKIKESRSRKIFKVFNYTFLTLFRTCNILSVLVRVDCFL